MATHWIWYILGPLLVGGYAFWYVRRYLRNRASYAAFAAERGWFYNERALELLGHCNGEPFPLLPPPGRGRGTPSRGSGVISASGRSSTAGSAAGAASRGACSCR